MKNSTKILFTVGSIIFLSACSESAPSGPDLTGVDTVNQAYFTKIFNRCNVGNTTNDCNCIAQVNVDHRSIAYAKYSSEFDSIHKPKMQADIEKMTATLAEKTMNQSDERVLEALEDDLHRLKVKLDNGVNNIDDFELPFLPKGATDACVITN
ncbi:MAG: hypothetical protein P8I94_01285 [Emcibacteraceae bacterium]|nr:hypothetical protein [Emcibacteraceae bacterium]